VTVWVRSHLRRGLVSQSAVTELTQRILRLVGLPDVEVGLELVGDGRMRRLNRRYRGRDSTTDVLAFAVREAKGPQSSLLGDVVISVPTAARQAAEVGRTLDQELTALLIHGVLHLLGFDHEKGDREARRMRQMEHDVLRAIQPLPKLVRCGLSIYRPVRRIMKKDNADVVSTPQ
jgi:probable rRNA maturation factor